MIIDAVVYAHVYKRGGVFPLPLSFFQQAAEQCGGSLLLKEDWSQVLFLCRDAIGISFWIQRPGEKPLHTITGFDAVELDELAQEMPELVDLWLHRHVNETWDEALALFVGSTGVSEYTRALALTYPQCIIARHAGLN